MHALLDELRGDSVELISEGMSTVGRHGQDREHSATHESPWVRDYGPIQLEVDGRPTWLDPMYLPERPGDDAMPRKLGQRHRVPVESFPYRLEGGALASDGTGICVMTSSSLSGTGLSRDALAMATGCRALAIVPPLLGEPTGHVDLVVHFLGPGLAAVGRLADVADLHAPTPILAANQRRLDEVAAELRRTARGIGRDLDIVRIPIFWDGERFLSYVNLVGLSDRLLVPAFEDVPVDIQTSAFNLLRDAAHKRIVPIDADGPGRAQGGLHCIILGLHTTSD